jgi:hypothetical protein
MRGSRQQSIIRYTDGQIVYQTDGRIINVTGLQKGSLNVFVFGGSLSVQLGGSSGDSGDSGIGRIQYVKYAYTFIGLANADAFTLEHEFAHHFIGNTLGKASFLKNMFADFYINDIVLPHLERYRPTMRDYSQQILNPQ